MQQINCKVEQDEITKELSNSFDYEFNGESKFIVPEFDAPKQFNIGLIVGQSGSGKSTILKKIGEGTYGVVYKASDMKYPGKVS